MSDHVKTISAHVVTFPRDVPYLGALRENERVNAKGYFVRTGNRTVYPTVDRSIVVRIESASGAVGWGETYGIVAPRTVVHLVDDLLAPFVVGRDPCDVVVIHDDLYDLMRVRGYNGGFYMDALAGIDIALWDLAAKQAGLPLCKLLGGQRHRQIPAYVSGLPMETLSERVEFARNWRNKGFNAFKFAAPVADDGLYEETKALRDGLGPDARIATDMHWQFAAKEAISRIRQLEPLDLWFAEAPVSPEDISGLAQVSSSVTTAVAAGEEWRTVFDMVSRVEKRAIDIFQPEMGHTGITEYLRMCHYAEANFIAIAPHATIGVGIFLAASLQVSATLKSTICHEFQHSVFPLAEGFLDSSIRCAEGYYTVPDGAGLGIEPSADAIRQHGLVSGALLD